MRRALHGAALVLALASCAPAPRAPLSSLNDLGRDEVMLVGRVDLVPPLQEHEQKIRGMVVGDFKNRIFLLADEKPRPLPEEPRLADYAGRIEAPLGSTFFVRSQGAPFYVLGGVLFIEIGGGGQQRVYFPGGYHVALKPGDRAVYIGTLRYYRDEFFEIRRVAVADEYGEANVEFSRKFGGGQVLRKALMTRTKPPAAR